MKDTKLQFQKWENANRINIKKKTVHLGTEGMTQVVEHLPIKCKTRGSEFISQYCQKINKIKHTDTFSDKTNKKNVSPTDLFCLNVF
jgi:uncharacterized FAD-dependent dehydrogenase